MDPTWLNALVALATFLSLIVSALIGYLFKLSKELSDYKTHVAEYYATKDEVKDLAERVERQIETGFSRMIEFLKQREAA
ncbi:hypothetical protein L4D76_26280 [Photobacterium sagamiensis]|uniref:hypothetical protein n=1 Tax=Photobacterium sagamiensis TaxID=2910241 RepID=UPI003D11DED0